MVIRRKAKVVPDRRTKFVSTRLTPEEYMQIKLYGLNNGKSVTMILYDGLMEYLERNGVKDE